ncbi:MAG: phytoene desaturase family protein [Caldivirga sp.]|uniref:phytoene desaturase family protein n=1 Tax=Caldivirga sp. TaxID=2080243 RepID=UPI003D146974
MLILRRIKASQLLYMSKAIIVHLPLSNPTISSILTVPHYMSVPLYISGNSLTMVKTALVIGGGHNGLMAAVTLRESGFNVTLIEARGKVGGMADTETMMGVKVSRAAYVLGLMPRRFVDKFNIPVIRQDPFQVTYINGKLIPFWRDRDKRVEALVKAGEVKFPEFEGKLLKFKELMESKFTFVNEPPSVGEIRDEAVKLGVEEFIEESCSRILSEYLSPDLHYTFMYPGMENSPAYLIAYFYSPDWSFVKGGMGTVGDAMLRYALSIGINVRLGVKVNGLEFKGDLVTGVITNEGILKGDVVVSSVSPILLDQWIKGKESSWRIPRPGWRKYNIVLKDYPRIPPELKPYAHSIMDTEAGELVIPSILDETRGGVVLEFMGDLDSLLDMMPDIHEKALVIDKLTPKDAEATYNVPNGDVNHIPMRAPYVLNGRPGYRTQFLNLFQGSAGNYPGGQITGVPGYNAARLAVGVYSA